ncbi:hypothetical protein FQN60_005915 [Etheostoma spectabile]|uniref:Tetraspanin n=1 Tax=Etheostoma spectabile TaxID=54343 RepID=A0A5J5CJF9_9PERO|nr:hypothetical protein FQN60_005915 [Etheostoma spectabile]
MAPNSLNGSEHEEPIATSGSCNVNYTPTLMDVYAAYTTAVMARCRSYLRGLAICVTVLLLFSALIFVEFVAVMVVASPLVQVQAQMGGAVDEVFLNVTPLHRAERYIQTELKKLQTSDSCCGLRSFEDWENQLPVSCFCTPPAADLQPR